MISKFDQDFGLEVHGYGEGRYYQMKGPNLKSAFDSSFSFTHNHC